MAKKLKVRDVDIQMRKIKEKQYVSLTDIIKNNSPQKPATVLVSWMRNNSTLLFLEEWEKTFNPKFKVSQMADFKLQAMDNRNIISPQNFIETTSAIGIISKSGRYGGTFAHKDIALNFCYWLSPVFQVAMIRAFQLLIEREAERQSLEWHISKITDNIDEVRNLLDTIPGQKPELNRLKK